MLRDRFRAPWRGPRRVSLHTLAATALLTACGGTDDVGPGGVFQPTTTGGTASSTAAGTGTGTGGTTTGTTFGSTADGGSTTGTATTTGTTGTTGFNSGFTSGVSTGSDNTTGTVGDGGMMTTTTNGGSGDYLADPVIPEVTGECPNFTSGSFSFSGISGEMEVGPMGSGDGALVFYWHGTGGQAGGFNSLFGGIGSANVSRVTSDGGIIFAVQGATGSGDSSCSGTAVFDGDFSVIDQVVACAVRDHNINPRRIYATGCSAGGLQSGCMAVRRTDYVAAVAPNSGGLVSSFGASLSNAASGNVPATMNMHGGSGDNVIINFGDSSAAFSSLIAGEGGLAIDCNHMSGHCGAPGDLYDAAFEFLFAHPFGTPSPYESGLPSSFPSYCEIQ